MLPGRRLQPHSCMCDRTRLDCTRMWMALSVHTQLLGVVILCFGVPARGVEGVDANHASTSMITGMDEVARVFREGDRRDRILAAMALGGGNRDIGRMLVEALNDKDASIRKAAISGLSELRWQPAVQAIALRLGDTEASARKMAAKALGNIGGPKAASALLIGIEAADANDASAIAAMLEALDETGASEAVAVAVSLARHPEAEVRSAAFVVLGKYRHFAAMDSMLRGLDGESKDVRAAALIALRRTVPPVRGSWDNVPELIKWLKSSSAQRRWYSLWRLAVIKDPNAVGAIMKVYPDEDDDVTSQAALALGAVGGEDATRALLDTLRSAKDPLLWSSAAVGLALHHERRAVPLLVENVTHPWNYHASLLALAEIGGQQAVEGAKRAYKVFKLTEPAVCLKVLAKLGDEDAWQELLKAARSTESAEARARVAPLLAYADEKRAIDPLVMLLHDKDARVRQAAAAAMAGMADLPPRARETLKESLADPDSEVRATAATALRYWRIRHLNTREKHP